MLEKIKQTADYLRGRAGELPKIGIILGTGLGTLVLLIVCLSGSRTRRRESMFFPGVIAIDDFAEHLDYSRLVVRPVEFHRDGKVEGGCLKLIGARHGHAGTLPLLRRLRHEDGDLPRTRYESARHRNPLREQRCRRHEQGIKWLSLECRFLHLFVGR